MDGNPLTNLILFIMLRLNYLFIHIAWILGSLCALLSCTESGTSGAEEPTVHPSTPMIPEVTEDSLLDSLEARYPQAGYAAVKERAKKFSLQGKSVAYFGASNINNKDSDVMKRMLQQNLGCSVVTYGHGGYSFGDNYNTLRSYADTIGEHDIYIVWCTTNDYFRNVQLGSVSDFTEADNFDLRNAETTFGGLNYILRKIRLRNPNALILGMTCPKFFNATRTDGMLIDSPNTNEIGFSFHRYVEASMECFRLFDIPYLDQWPLECFTQKNWQEFYMPDGVHLNQNGYFILGVIELSFILDQLNKHLTGIY